MHITITLLLFFVAECFSYNSTLHTIGPTFHVNFGNGEVRLSGGIEYACWFLPSCNHIDLPVGFDIGLEFERNKVRVYSEVQTGVVFAGAALGPVIEYSNDIGVFTPGIQGSLWGAYFGGVNIRFRRVEFPVFSPGLFLKYIGSEIPIGC